MKKIIILFSSLLLIGNLGFAQTETEIDSLLLEISKTENAIDLVKTPAALVLIAYGESTLPVLATFFVNNTPTQVYSKCQDRKLSKGEVAMIMADRIEGMPYALLTGIQNCLLTFCENNPNLIEYYLWAIRRDGAEGFKNKYLAWLESNDRIEWTPLLDYKSKRERKKEIRKRKRANRKEQPN